MSIRLPSAPVNGRSTRGIMATRTHRLQRHVEERLPLFTIMQGRILYNHTKAVMLSDITTSTSRLQHGTDIPVKHIHCSICTIHQSAKKQSLHEEPWLSVAVGLSRELEWRIKQASEDLHPDHAVVPDLISIPDVVPVLGLVLTFRFRSLAFGL